HNHHIRSQAAQAIYRHFERAKTINRQFQNRERRARKPNPGHRLHGLQRWIHGLAVERLEGSQQHFLFSSIHYFFFESFAHTESRSSRRVISTARNRFSLVTDQSG